MIQFKLHIKIQVFFAFGLFVFMSIHPLTAQIYTGGTGDGHSEDRYLGNLTGENLQGVFQGGMGNGYACKYMQGDLQGTNISTLFQGGIGSGYGEDRLLQNLSGVSLAGMFQGGSDEGFDQYWVRGSLLQAMVFPVELLSFEAIVIDESVRLQWATASEINHDFFSIERSVNARDFEEIQEISGTGNSQETRNYETWDHDPYTGTSFYRLKSVDVDGAYQYSRIVEVHISALASNELILYPNPNVGETLSVRWQRGSTERQIEISITDLQGRNLYAQRFHNPSTQLETSIPLGESFNTGAYLLTIKSPSQQQSKLFIIH